MSKSIKLQNDTYWDGNSVVIDKQKLPEYLKSCELICASSSGISGAGTYITLSKPLNAGDKIVVVLDGFGVISYSQPFEVVGVNDNDFNVFVFTINMNNGWYDGFWVTDCRFLFPSEDRKTWRLDVTSTLVTRSSLSGSNDGAKVTKIYLVH